MQTGFWKTMSGESAVVLINNAPDKKCKLLGFIFMESGIIHPCVWDSKGIYFGHGDLAFGKCDLSELDVEMNKRLSIEDFTK